MRPRPEERRQWAEESQESEAPQGYGDGEDEPSGASVVVGGGRGRADGGFESAAGTEEAPALAARASFIAFANIILLEAPITDPTFR